MPWNPEHYQKFKSQRSAPFFDLFKLVEIRPDIKVVDLGCGTGELTRHLADSLPGSDVLGLDSSSEMLEKTRTNSWTLCEKECSQPCLKALSFIHSGARCFRRANPSNKNYGVDDFVIRVGTFSCLSGRSC